MKKVILYTTRHCPHCVRAKSLLTSKKVNFKEVDLTDDDKTRNALEKKTGWMTVPMIFIGEEFIGGADDLYALEAEGKLDQKIKSDS